MWRASSGVNDRLLGACHNIALIVAANILPSVIFLLAAEPFSTFHHYSFLWVSVKGIWPSYYMEGCVVVFSVEKQMLE